MKDKGFKILFVIYLIALVIDLISTIINWDLIKYLESNPLFKFGGLPLIIVANIIIAVLWLYWYSNTKNVNMRFIIIFILIAVIMTRAIVITNNFQIHQDYVENREEVMEAAKQVTDEQKTQTIKKAVGLNLLPFLNGVLAWVFFSLDHKIKRKKEVK